MSVLKQLKWSMILLALAYIVLGIVLILYPQDTMRVTVYILAVTVILVGIFSLINYMRGDLENVVYRHDLVVGFSAIIGGILIILNVDKLLEILPVILGFIVTISGILKFQSAIDMMRMKSAHWQYPFALAIINIVYGVLLLINPFSAELLLILLGIGLVYSGLTDLIVTVMISTRLAQLQKAVKEATADIVADVVASGDGTQS